MKFADAIANRPVGITPQHIPDILDLDLSKPYSGQVRISAEAAALLLPEYNIGNRRKRSSLVLYLQRQIENGEWQPDHPQPLVFSDQGRLIDGQHRLYAIANSGETVIANVVIGVRDALREYIDTGISRQLEDRVSFSPDHVLNHHIAKIINQWFNLAKRGGKPTPSEALDVFNEHREAIMFAVVYAARHLRGLSAAPVIVALAQMWEKDSDKADSFAANLYSPEGQLQQARRLREYLISTSMKGMTSGESMRKQVYLKSIGAMRAYMEGRTVSVLRSAAW